MDYLEDILTGARDLRKGLPCAFVDGGPYQGGSHRVFKLVFEDSVQWAARVCERPEDWEYDMRATKIFQHIKQQHPDIRAPNVFFREKHPVLYSEWVDGEPLAIWNLDIPLQKRQTLLNDLADFLLQLWTTSPPPDLVLARDRSYSAWLTGSLDRGVRRTLSGKARWGDAIDHLIMRSMIPAYTSRFDNFTDIGLAHGDLNANNIMRSDEFHLTGVIDWDCVFAAPLPAVIHHPWFIADIPGWKNAGVRKGETFADDCLFLETAIEQKERSWQLPPTISTLLRGSGERFFFQSAFHCKGVYEDFVRIYCARTEENLKAASSQLDIVLCLYPDLVGTETVERVQSLLGREICEHIFHGTNMLEIGHIV